MTNLSNEEKREASAEKVIAAETTNLSEKQMKAAAAEATNLSEEQKRKAANGEVLKLSKEQKHKQCMREIKGTVVVVLICCIWHIATAFALNGTGLYFLGMPAWFTVSVFGTIVLAIAGVIFLLKKVFVDFEYDDSEEGEEVYND